MAPIWKNTINHFTHPAHNLTEIKSDEEYKCDGCKLNGNGTRFSCNECGFDLHEHCAKCPMTLTSSGMHPSHPLRLVVHQVSLGTRYCHACRKPIEGLIYQCSTKDCSFDLHPGCADTSRTTNTHEQGQGAPAAPATGSVPRGQAGNVAQQVGVGIAINAAYDGIKSLVMSLFESSADS